MMMILYSLPPGFTLPMNTTVRLACRYFTYALFDIRLKHISSKNDDNVKCQICSFDSVVFYKIALHRYLSCLCLIIVLFY